MKKDKRIDTYIEKSADFAKPVMKHLRNLIHKGCPDVEETLKWGFPHFLYKGIICSMAAFKEHCAFGFWKSALMKDADKSFAKNGETAMGQLGKIKKLSDLPSDKILRARIKEAMKLNEAGIKRIPAKAKPAEKKALNVPPYFQAVLKKNKKALETFNNLSPSHQKEYIEWIIDAKTETTREKRIATTLEWLIEGKSRNWKY